MIFLAQTPHGWRGLRQRPHHLMQRFAGRGEHYVRWVETRYLRWLIDQPRDFFRAQDEQPSPNLEVRTVTLVNGERLGPIRAHNQYWLARRLDAPLPPRAQGPRILWLYNPHEVHLVDRVKHDLLIYDIMDEYRGFPWSPPQIEREEAALLRRADWIFAGTHALYEAKKPQAPDRIECVLSGVDTDHFLYPSESGKNSLDYADLRKRHSYLAGYAGMIDLRMDIEALAAAARALPQWGFVLLGSIRTDISELQALSNVYLPGPQPYDALPSHYHAWDVALLPFVENELTRHINPTKMLEYGAARRPIVARALPEVQRYYAGGAWLYEAAEEFTGQLEALESVTDSERNDRVKIALGWARDRSWDALATRMLARVESLLKQNQSG